MIRRKIKYELFAPVILFVVLLLWFITGAIAETTPAREGYDIIQIQWKVIVALLGLVQVLIGFIYIQGINSVKRSISKLFDQIDALDNKKLDIEIHKELCLLRKERK